MMRFSLFFSTILLLFTFGCKTKKATSGLNFAEQQNMIFLDSVAACQVIIVDESEGFFESVTALDMKIQMKRNYEEDISRENILKDYKKYLQQDVQTFSAAEKEGLTKVFENAFKLCEKLNKDIFPKNLQLIKSGGGPYGPTTFYTRDNSIVIPSDLLGTDNIELLLDVALHEIFHIYSRYHPQKKKELYQLIGYKPVDKELLDLPDALQNRLLLNPDGINYAYLIKIKTETGKSIPAIPLIVSTQTDFDPAQKTFFAYLQFDLYQIEPPFVRRIKVKADNDGNSIIDYQKLPDFFRQIKDNTNYIIHPDEIMADNFVLVAQRQILLDKNELSLSEEGLLLLDQVEEILRKVIVR